MDRRILAVSLLAVIAFGMSAVYLAQRAESATGSAPEVLPKYRFMVEIDGIVKTGFREVEGLNVTVDDIECREGTGQTAPRLLPGVARYGPITLRYGVTESTELWQWMKQVLDGSSSIKRSRAVILMDRAGNEVVRYLVSNAWPSSWRLGKLDSLGSGVAIEELVIQCEGITVESAAE